MSSRIPRAAWPLAAVAVLAAAIGWNALTHVRPSYDAFGWLVWGRQALHWQLNTDGAPSWKPLSFLFTLPYAPFGRTQIWLWSVTATAAAFSGAVFGGRIAYRLTRLAAPAGTRAAAALGAIFAGVAVIGMDGFSHQVMIATSDPMVVALVLAAIDAHLSRRPALAFAALMLASLGRPETWPFSGLYATWAWRSRPRLRPAILAGLLLIPAAWFVIPGLTSHSWFVSGDLALKSPTAIHHHQLAGVLDRFLGLYGLPMRLAVVAALVLAALRRDLVAMGLAGAATVWVVIEVAFAYHGWPAEPRYMMEAAAVAVVLVGAAIGQILSHDPRGPWAFGAVAVVALLVALAPIVSRRVGTIGREIDKARLVATRIDRLPIALAGVDGPAGVRACGHPVTTVGFQSTLAWYLERNVGNVGYKPGREIDSGRPIVLFKAVGSGWEVRPIHTLRSRWTRCMATVRLNLDTGEPLPPPPPPPRLGAVDGSSRRPLLEPLLVSLHRLRRLGARLVAAAPAHRHHRSARARRTHGPHRRHRVVRPARHRARHRHRAAAPGRHPARHHRTSTGTASVGQMLRRYTAG